MQEKVRTRYMNRKLKIAIIIPVPPENTGITIELEWINEVAKNNNVDVSILTFTKSPKEISQIKLLSLKSNLFYPFQIMNTLKKGLFDIVHIEYIYGLYANGHRSLIAYIKSSFILVNTLIASKITNIKVVVSMHRLILSSDELKKFKFPRIFYLTAKYINSFVYIFADRLNVFNKASKDRLDVLYNNSLKTSAIPLPCPIFDFNAVQHRQFTYFFFGFIKPNKGILELLSAFSMLSHSEENVALILVGGKDYSDLSQENHNYFNLVKERVFSMQRESFKVESHFDFVSDDQINELLARSDVIILPYLDNYFEASGVVSRLLFSGLPFICSKTHRFEDAISYEMALPAEPGDINDLFLKMKLVLVDTVLYRKLSWKAKCSFYKLSGSEVALRYLKLYLNLTRDKTMGKEPEGVSYY